MVWNGLKATKYWKNIEKVLTIYICGLTLPSSLIFSCIKTTITRIFLKYELKNFDSDIKTAANFMLYAKVHDFW